MQMLSQPVIVGALFSALLGALVGSFSNVVIWRLPRGESVVWPGSHCPRCNRKLTALELIPVLSWAFQRGRCRGCGERVSARYPLVELLNAAGWFVLALRWPPFDAPLTFALLAVLFTVLVILSFIDIDTLTLPDVLTLPAFGLALLLSLAQKPGSLLPGFREALLGGLAAAGALTLINRLGGLLLRRLRDTKERLWPLGFDQVNLAAAVGLLFGWPAGLLAALGSLGVNLVSGRLLRLPEPVVYLIWFAGFLVLVPYVLPLGFPAALEGTFVAAGGAALAGAWWWWLHSLHKPAATDVEDPAADEPVAMGFGDAKLAAVLGALVGGQGFIVAFLAAVVFGALGGIISRALGGGRQIPFGPYLVLGGILALFFGDSLAAWYLGSLGLT